MSTKDNKIHTLKSIKNGQKEDKEQDTARHESGCCYIEERFKNVQDSLKKMEEKNKGQTCGSKFPGKGQRLSD